LTDRLLRFPLSCKTWDRKTYQLDSRHRAGGVRLRVAASWSVLGALTDFLLFGLFSVKTLYGSGKYTISAAIAQIFGWSTMLTVSRIMIYALLLVNVGS
jgi:hypothetical protein